MKRRKLLPALAIAALPARTLLAQRRPRIGFLSVDAPNPDHPLVRASEEGLREHGLVDEQTATFVYRWAGGRVDALPALAAELAALPVDVIVTGNSADYVRAGALLSYGTDLVAQWRRAGWYVARIAAGARPAELPVEQPARFETAINLRTARALGLNLPQSLLLRVDEVIE